ncbi:uncharacterized protein ARMOST_05455 [Armillaria ostoyae]|uniref:Uncharacterized protein n=1 Tax=Armillaria ostoyae TaxID=47428 RepID=A0A284R071_ARMOS|nr:uncharacterized protein ARMOST_05455 [Armillaria ostoyae]
MSAARSITHKKQHDSFVWSSLLVYRLSPRAQDSLENQDTLLSDQACFGIDSDTDSLRPSRPQGLRTQEEVHCLIGKWDNLLTFQLACFDTEMLGNEVGYFQWSGGKQSMEGKDLWSAMYVKQYSTV